MLVRQPVVAEWPRKEPAVPWFIWAGLGLGIFLVYVVLNDTPRSRG